MDRSAITPASASEWSSKWSFILYTSERHAEKTIPRLLFKLTHFCITRLLLLPCPSLFRITWQNPTRSWALHRMEPIHLWILCVSTQAIHKITHIWKHHVNGTTVLFMKHQLNPTIRKVHSAAMTRIYSKTLSEQKATTILAPSPRVSSSQSVIWSPRPYKWPSFVKRLLWMATYGVMFQSCRKGFLQNLWYTEMKILKKLKSINTNALVSTLPQQAVGAP